MVFGFRKKKADEDEAKEDAERPLLPEELEKFRLAEPGEKEEQFPFHRERKSVPQPEQPKTMENELDLILSRLDAVEARLKVVEEKLKRL
jgi:hypothetical protein